MPTFDLENGYPTLSVCGCDEVGRAPLAGPVVAGCVFVSPDTHFNPLWQEVNDSKKISKKHREILSEQIKEHSHWGIGQAHVEEVDAINIVQASFLAMTRAYENMNKVCDIALIDGNLRPKTFPCPVHTVVKGDTLSVSIAAASIIAKVYRDKIMADLTAMHPQYGWERNAGYPTRQHLQALEAHGVTPHHRASFAPVKRVLKSQ